MKFSASQIAQLLEGEVVGDIKTEVSGLSKIDNGKKGTLSFLANPAYTEFIYTTEASVVIVSKNFKPEKDLPEGLTLIKVEDAYRSFAKLLELYNEFKYDRKGISENAFIDPTAIVGKDVYIGPGVVIDSGAKIGDRTKIFPQAYVGQNARIGSDTLIHPAARILADCEIGAHCVIHSGVIIGGDGFGFAPNSENNYQKVAQIGNVIIEDHVEIGAGTTIDRATLGHTIIRKGAKIDNLIQIAHNVEIGENTVIAAQTGIAGSTKIGKNCMIGGQVGMVGHITIADGVKIAAQSGIGHSIKEEGKIVQGSPAIPIGDYKRSYIGFKNLPDLMKEIKSLKEEIKNLKATTHE
ncbi:MAG TPA: UDP-3-O-(3-hydroxymyristoyl)glucosamine N-acyltransferase [Cryomorphaceae bacterium]|nr:UDP-3-O-(3-hydroxymyristoyl)glucosamine N-acyltransferase [Cryomorphaceae bacterium]